MDAPIWDDQECVDCATADPATPVLNAASGQCEACPAAQPIWHNGACSTCFEANGDTPVFDANLGCVACPDGEGWDAVRSACVTDNCRVIRIN